MDIWLHEKFFDFLKEHAIKIINFEKKKAIPYQMNNSNRMKRHKSAGFAKRLVNKYTNNGKFRKVRDHCHRIVKYRSVVHSI